MVFKLNSRLQDKNAAKARAAADRARDCGDWEEAAKKYGEYLKVNGNSNDWDIWIQYGHALKESGELGEALKAYDCAASIKKDDSDVHLSRGHALKLLGRKEEALAAYRASFELDGKNSDALKEIITLDGTAGLSGTDESIRKVVTGKIIYFDITDLMEYVKHNPSLSGIQRVSANLVENFNKWMRENEGYRIIPVVPEYDNFRVFAVNHVLVMAMINALRTHAGRDLLDKAIRAVYDSRRIVVPEAGDFFVISGAFWIYQHYDMLMEQKGRGIKFCVFVHDLIQISNPEYVHKEAKTVFRRAFSDVAFLADFLLTNSVYVAEDVRKYCKTRLGIDMPVVAVPLATELSVPAGSNTPIPRDISEVSKTDYILSVSTIEIRKNHKYLIKLWEHMIRNFDGLIPNLVLVGKWGWAIDDLREYIERSDYLGGRLYIFNGIDDASLDLLYQNCLFTMFPSFAEGFGLPVGESLAHGKICLSSNRTSMPEVGGEFARYYDPDNRDEGYQLVTSLLKNRPEIERLNADIRKNYKAKDWETFSREFFGAVVNTPVPEIHGGVRCVIDSSDIIGMGRDEIEKRDIAGRKIVYLSPTRRTGWHPVETWGCWTSTRRAQLKFQTDSEPDEKVQVYLLLQAPMGSENVRCKISIGVNDTYAEDIGNSPKWFLAEGSSSAGMVTVDFFSIGKYAKPDQRDLYIGLKALAWCRKSDFEARTSLLERFVLGLLK